jgi:TRAP-type C4-dicarboxylate transport system substrate-binding protein
MKQPIRLRWVLAHVPYDLFLRSANIFADKVREKSNGQIEIEVIGLPEWNAEYRIPSGKEAIEHGSEVIHLVDNGTIEMSQMLNTELCRLNKDLSALEMPFIFRDHDHATRVLDGNIGMELLTGISKESNVKGLAFTYSGGFRMIVGNKPVESVEDFAGNRVRTSWTEVAHETFNVLGAEPVDIRISETADAIMKDVVDLGENTWARYYRYGLDKCTTHVSDTKHSLFLTAIIINKDVWASLGEEMQKFMQEAALEAAASERLESLEDGAQAKARCAQDGITVHDWNEEELAKLKSITDVVYDKYADFFAPGLIEDIKKS